mmetsp:Transcript_7520/g.9821  ORF Transcript_7520/g.9821 Transcript_7520/m.9821 type:complete len:82 (+) Transcript_7520:831-1076(+)
MKSGRRQVVEFQWAVLLHKNGNGMKRYNPCLPCERDVKQFQITFSVAVFNENALLELPTLVGLVLFSYNTIGLFTKNIRKQ